MSWQIIRRELLRRKNNNEPVRTLERGVLNWIDDVGTDYVIVHSEQAKRPGNRRPLTKDQIEACSAPHACIKRAIKQLGDC